MDTENIYIALPGGDTIEVDYATSQGDLECEIDDYNDENDTEHDIDDCNFYGDDDSIIEKYFIGANGDIDQNYWDLFSLDADNDVIIAACELGLDTSTIDEAYQGQYDSDADFAQETFESIYCGDTELNSWPFNCIDWESAAYDLMFDYSEQDGYYFRNM